MDFIPFKASSEWDVEEYYDSTMPPNHWALKKAFIEKHKNDFEKYRLLALANTFVNMEFMGARYPPEVEQEVRALTNQVTEISDYRSGRVNSLKRTFVSASDASRSRLLKTNLDLPKVTKKSIYTQNKLASLSDDDIKLLDKVRNQENHTRSKIVLNFSEAASSSYHIVQSSCVRAMTDIMLHKPGKIDEKGQSEYVVILEGEELARGYAQNEKKAKEFLGPIALKNLQETCFSVIVKSHLIGESINKDKMKNTQMVHEKSLALPEDNKGAKMMRLMGWTGSGLGKNQDGIEKPIEATRNISRMGLLDQTNDIKTIKNVINKVLEDYIKDTEFYNLVFSNEYTNNERKIIHEVAQKMNLKSKSYGKKDERRLVVCKKMSQYELVTELLACGRENANYKLLLPTKITVKSEMINTPKTIVIDDEEMEVLDEVLESDDDQIDKVEDQIEQEDYKQYYPLTRPERKELKRQRKQEIREEKEKNMLSTLSKDLLDKKEAKKLRKQEAKLKKNQATKECKALLEISKMKIVLSVEDQMLLKKAKSQFGIRGKLVIYQAFTQKISDFQLILQSAQKYGVKTTVAPVGNKQNGLQEYVLKIGGETISKEFIQDGNDVKNILGEKALQSLQQTCFTIIVKANKRGTFITRQEILGPNCSMPVKGHLQTPLTQEETDLMRHNLMTLFKEYVASSSPDHLVFDTQFTEKERKALGALGSPLKLKTMHYGKQGGRTAVVSKIMDRWELVEVLLAKGGETVCYKLVRPTQISVIMPDILI